MADQPRAPWTPPQVHDLAEVRDALNGGIFILDGIATQGSIP